MLADPIRAQACFRAQHGAAESETTSERPMDPTQSEKGPANVLGV